MKVGDRIQSPSCNFPEPREAHAFLDGLDRPLMIRGSAPIRLPANKISDRYEPLLQAGYPDKTARLRGSPITFSLLRRAAEGEYVEEPVMV